MADIRILTPEEQAEEYELSVFRKMLTDKVGETYTTAEMQEKFTVVGFCGGYCVVVRKSDNQRGSLDFTHMPRFYHTFKEG